MPEMAVCDLCGKRMAPHSHYVLKMDLYADPSMPPLNTEDVDEADPSDQLNDLLEQMKGMTAEELHDQVHRRFEFKLCARCQKTFLTNPLGLPRSQATGDN